MKRPIKLPDGFPDETVFLPDFQACSATECTGLIASKPETEEEREAYDEIFCYEVPYAEKKIK